MIENIKNALKTEYKELGLSEKTIGRLADYVKGLVEKEEDIATAVKRDDVKLIATSIQGEIDGIKRAKEAAETALADYKAKHPEGEPQVNTQTEPQQTQQPDVAQAIADAIAAAIAPLTEKINTLESSASAKEALTTARESFFGGDYAKKYKDQAQEAWERAVEINEATGSKMSAAELSAKATGYFNKSVSKLGVDTSKPFVADPSVNDNKGTMDWSAEKKRLQDAGRLPSEQQQ